MKRVIATLVIIISISSVAAAQAAGSNTSTTTPAVSSRGSSTVAKNGNSTLLKYPKLKQRRTYHWKNGQRATPTGQQATSVNGGYSSLVKKQGTLVDKKEATKKDEKQ